MIVNDGGKNVNARLVLEDGACFEGQGFGARLEASHSGEVVFNTAMTGYQEALSDPSYSGQILCMTAPQIGNYGVCDDDLESSRPQVRGMVVRELSRVVSNHRARGSLEAWLARHGVVGIQGIDTRALVRRIREAGALRGLIAPVDDRPLAELVELCRAVPSMAGQNLACAATTETRSAWAGDLGEWAMPTAPATERRWHVVAIDCGAKQAIYRHLAGLGCDVTFVPCETPVDEILALEPDGLMVTNGPGDPAAVDVVVAGLQSLIGRVPMFGICLGHQLLALALGAKTYKLKFGHRGANQPVRNAMTGCVEITSQNHGFCVDADSIRAAGAEVTHVHLNDGTAAGFRHREHPLFSVQHHPEASPGPHDSSYLFDCFVEMMATHQPPDAKSMSLRQRARRTAAVT